MVPLAPLFLLFSFCALPAAPAAVIRRQAQERDPVQDQIDEFKKYYKPNRTTHEKVEAIHVLDKLDRVSAAELLLDACGDPQFPVREAALQVLSLYGSDDVRTLLRKVAGDEAGNKSGRRGGAIQTLGTMKDVPAVVSIVKALGGGDFELKRAAIVALGQIGDPAAVDPLIKLLGEAEPALKTAVLDALGSLRKPESSIAAMLPLLEAPDWQVRTAAIAALGKMRSREVVEPLIGALEREEGRLRDEALRALQNTTALEYGDDAAEWKRWWENAKAGWKVPSDAELAKRKEAIAKAREQYQKKAATEFASVPTKSRRMLFVIDTSGSMEDLIADTKSFKLQDRGYKSYMKMEIVKDELIRTIESLEPYVRFNILTFASAVKQWKPGLVAANVVNKAAAVKLIQELKPIGGASQGFNQRAGLSGSAGIAGGKTNTYAALMAGLGAAGKGIYDKNYGSEVDTIFFLSDGVPSTGDYVEKDDILAEVRRVNTLKKLVIHTISIGDMDHALMEQLATQNGGAFVDLGK